MKRTPPIGSAWRILAHGKGPSYAVQSKDYDDRPAQTEERVQFSTVFDELVISGLLHVEQMSPHTWFVGLGNGEKFMLSVGRNGAVTRGEMYR